MPRVVVALVIAFLLGSACEGDDATSPTTPQADDEPTATVEQTPSPTEATSPPEPVIEEGTEVLELELTPEAEVPGPGATGAGGKVRLTLEIADREICWRFRLQGVRATAAHLHEGNAEEAGDVVVNLFFSGTRGENCVPAQADLIEDMQQHPADYYVNVHSREFPDGALRAQLDSS